MKSSDEEWSHNMEPIDNFQGDITVGVCQDPKCGMIHIWGYDKERTAYEFSVCLDRYGADWLINQLNMAKLKLSDTQ